MREGELKEQGLHKRQKYKKNKFASKGAVQDVKHGYYRGSIYFEKFPRFRGKNKNLILIKPKNYPAFMKPINAQRLHVHICYK